MRMLSLHAPPLCGSLPPGGADLARERPFAAVARSHVAAWHHWLQAAACALALGSAAPAWAEAELWGFIDAQGRPQYADRQLDSRYKLFHAGSAPVKRQRPSTASAPPGLLTSFEVSAPYKAVRHLIREAAAAHGLEYELLKAVVATESGFNPKAVSPKGAVGLMQLMPTTAQRFGVQPQATQTLQERLTDPRTNLQAGARYLALLLRQFGGETQLALAAYNAGEGAVLRAGRQVPNYPETQKYVRTVSQLYQHLLPQRALSQPIASDTPPAVQGGARGRGNMPTAL